MPGLHSASVCLVNKSKGSFGLMKKLLSIVLLMLNVSAFSEEFNNFCTTSLSEGNFHVTDCSVNEKVGGKTYCFGNNVAKDIFLDNPQEVIKKAEQFYTASLNDERKKITQDEVDNILNNDPECDLSNLDVGYLNFSGKDLTHCKMVNISFFGADLRGANLSGADLQRAYLNLARLEEANFTGANLSMATIFQPIFGNTNFHKANLRGVRLIGTLGKVDMSGADVSDADLGLDVGNQPMGQMKFDSTSGNFENTNFENTNLNIASFKFANLRGANLKNTNLNRAELIQADLTGADLTGADLNDAEVNNAEFKDVVGLDKVKNWNKTVGKCSNCPSR